MKNILIILMSVLIYSLNAVASDKAKTSINDYLIEVETKPSSISINNYEDYKASTDDNYTGRNNRVIKNINHEVIKNTGSRTRSVLINKGSSSYKYDNTESVSGEMVDKLETDRMSFSKKQHGEFIKHKTKLEEVYLDMFNINVEKLGKEQDPYIQSAFKCADYDNCDKYSLIDKHAIVNCEDTERIHWTGKKWQCVGLLKTPPVESCSSRDEQYAEETNGGVACINYIHEWDENGLELCQSTGLAQKKYICNRKTLDGKVVEKEVSGDLCLAPKPVNFVECGYYGDWKLGKWGTCSKSCGGGIQYRTVSCSKQYCSGTQPLSVQACNEFSCDADWVVGEWSTCSASCGTGLQTRSVTCPAGLNCVGEKPSTSQYCNQHDCIADWIIGDWSECSKSCDGGVKTRSVYCPTKECKGSKPATSETCNTNSCNTGKWIMGSWSTCIGVCNAVKYKYRYPICSGGTCDDSLKPDVDKKSCGYVPCDSQGGTVMQ